MLVGLGLIRRPQSNLIRHGIDPDGDTERGDLESGDVAFGARLYCLNIASVKGDGICERLYLHLATPALRRSATEKRPDFRFEISHRRF